MNNLDYFEFTPKQFMVWDKVGKQFLSKRLPNGVDMVFSIFELPLGIDCLDEEEKKQFSICQSTNLFDEDGREIFEGSIVQNEKGWKGIVKMFKGQWVVKYVSGTALCHHLLHDISKQLKLIGHILSDPELLEDEK